MKNTYQDESFSAIYRESVAQIMSLLPADLSAIAKHNAGWRTGSFDPRKYLLDSEVRYLRALRLIRLAGANKVLDVGGFLAAFPLALSRMGFSVSIAEKFSYYEHALDGVAEHLKSNGVSVIDADFTEASDSAISLPFRFDAVTCMAVAEHLAHTPKFLLENISAALIDRGSLIFEVPNIAFWPRRAALFFKGSTTCSPITDVYHSAVPYTGHHREYTLDDARYVVREAGFDITSEETFNYSLGGLGLVSLLKHSPAFVFKNHAEVIILSCKKSS